MENNPHWKTTFFKFWMTQALSLLGSGLASFALVWWITDTTGSSTVLATVSLATLLPGILLGPLAGAIVDQFNRKWIMILADAISALLAILLVLLFWAGTIQLWHIVVINILRALAGAFQFPAMQSSTSLMVPQEELARVAGLNQALQGIGMIATPPLGALLLTILPIHMILSLDVITAALAIFLLFTITIPQLQTQDALKRVSINIWHEMQSGFSFIRQWSALLNIMGIATLLNMVLIPAFTLVPILVTKQFQGSAFQLGWMNAAYGIGIAIGGLLLGAWGGFKKRIHTSLFGLAGLGIGSLMIGVASTNGYWLAMAGMLLVGIMNAFANGPFFAILQSVISPDMQGRVFTVLMSVSSAAAPIGLALAGPVTERFGVQIWYLLSATISIGIFMWIISRPDILRLEEWQTQSEMISQTATD